MKRMLKKPDSSTNKRMKSDEEKFDLGNLPAEFLQGVVPYLNNQSFISFNSTCTFFKGIISNHLTSTSFRERMGAEYGTKYKLSKETYCLAGQLDACKDKANELIKFINSINLETDTDASEEESKLSRVIGEFNDIEACAYENVYLFPVIYFMHERVTKEGLKLEVEGFNLLSFCIEAMNLPCVKFLLEAGYETCPVSENGYTPLLSLLDNGGKEHYPAEEIFTFSYELLQFDKLNKFNLKFTLPDGIEGKTLLWLLVQQNCIEDNLSTNHSQSLKNLIALIIDKLDIEHLKYIESELIIQIPEEYMVANDIFEFALQLINKKCQLNLDAEAIIDAANGGGLPIRLN